MTNQRILVRIRIIHIHERQARFIFFNLAALHAANRASDNEVRHRNFND